MASHSNKNKKKKKRKIKDLTIEELLGEQPFYSSHIEKLKSRNSNIEELLREQPFYSSYIEKPKSRNLSIEESLSEQPFYKAPIEKPSRKKLSNLQLLQVLPFYDDGGIFKRQKAHKKCLASYNVECIAKNSLNDSLFSSKKSIKNLFNDLLREKKRFKYYLGTTVTLKKRTNNGFEIKTLTFYSKTKTVIKNRYYLEDAFNELINRIDQ